MKDVPTCWYKDETDEYVEHTDGEAGLMMVMVMITTMMMAVIMVMMMMMVVMMKMVMVVIGKQTWYLSLAALAALV